MTVIDSHMVPVLELVLKKEKEKKKVKTDAKAVEHKEQAQASVLVYWEACIVTLDTAG